MHAPKGTSAEPIVPASTEVELSASRAGGPIRVALLRPQWVVLNESAGYVMPTPPVGIAYIAGALRAAGNAVQVIDSVGEGMERAEEFRTRLGTIRRIGLTPTEMVEAIEPGTQMVGITNMFAHEWPTCREIAELAKARFPAAVIVMGGENSTAFWPWVFEQTQAVDCVVLGEGEQTVVELAARIAANVPFAGMTGVAAREGVGGHPVTGGLPIRMRKAAVDTVPRPAWDLFPLQSYFDHKGASGVDRGRSMPLLATRGCPYKCSFCSSPNMWTTRYVVREPQDVVDEIESYVHAYQIDNVDFVDLTPITKRSWTLELCDELERRNLDVSLQLPIGTRSEAIDDEVLRQLARAGCTNITFAPETGSERMLEVFDKRLDLDHVLLGITAARRAGLITNIHMILGHPQERWPDRWHNWTFMVRAARAGLHVSGMTLFYPYPGSRDFRELLDAGKLKVDDDYCYDSLTRGGGSATYNWNPQLTTRQLHLLRMATVASFTVLTHLLHPRQLVHLVRTLLFGGQEQTFIEQGIRTKRRGPLSKNRVGLAPISVGGAPEAGAQERELVTQGPPGGR